LILPRCTRASLIDNLAPVGQRRDVEADDIHLQFDSIGMLNHGANDSILNFAVMRIDADFSPTANSRFGSLAGTRRMYAG